MDNSIGFNIVTNLFLSGTAHKAPETVGSKDDNLEDWLDSVLD